MTQPSLFGTATEGFLLGAGLIVASAPRWQDFPAVAVSRSTTLCAMSDVVLIAVGVPGLRGVALSAGRQDLRCPRIVGRLGARREDGDNLRNGQATILSFELLFQSMLRLRTEGSVVDRILPGSHGSVLVLSVLKSAFRGRPSVDRLAG